MKMINISEHIKDLQKTCKSCFSGDFKILEVGQYNYCCLKVRWWDKDQGYMVHVFNTSIGGLHYGSYFADDEESAKTFYKGWK